MRFMSLGLAAVTAAMFVGGDAQAFGKRNRGGSSGCSPCGGSSFVSHSSGFHSSGYAAPIASGCSSCGQSAFLDSNISGGYAFSNQPFPMAWSGQPQFQSSMAWSGQPQIQWSSQPQILQSGLTFQSQPQIIQSGIQPAQPVQSGHLMIQNNANIQPGMTFIAEPGPQQGTIILRPSNQPRQQPAPADRDNK